MPLISVRLAVALLTGCVACSSLGKVARGADSPFAGTWVQREAVLGTSFVLTLAVDGTSVSTMGTYTAPEGRSGTLTGKGTISAEELHLDLTYGNGELAQFDGQLASAPVLTGRLHFGSPRAMTPSAVVTFDRKKSP